MLGGGLESSMELAIARPADVELDYLFGTVAIVEGVNPIVNIILFEFYFRENYFTL